MIFDIKTVFKNCLIMLFIVFNSTLMFAQEIKIPEPTKNQWFNTQHAFKDCMFKGQKMDCVKVIFTNADNADFKVKIVEDNEDLTVRYITTSSHLNSCGQWRIVTSEVPDFKVAIVEYNEDFTIRITDTY